MSEASRIEIAPSSHNGQSPKTAIASAGSAFPAVLGLMAAGFALSLAQRAILFATAQPAASPFELIRFDVITWGLFLALSPAAIAAARRWDFSGEVRRDAAAHIVVAAVLALVHSIGLEALSAASFRVDGFAQLLTWRLGLDMLVYLAAIGVVILRNARAQVSLREHEESPPDAGVLPIAFPDGTQTIFFGTSEILWIEGAGDYASVCARGRRWLVSETLSSLEQRLPAPPFLRTHRSAIVNLTQVARLRKSTRHRHEAVLRDGQVVPVSQARREIIEERFSRLP